MRTTPAVPHAWNVTPGEAIMIQKTLRDSIDTRPLDRTVAGGTKGIRYIAGADISCNRFSPIAYAGIVVLSYPDMQVVDSACVKDDMPFPYIPGLLSFREIPALLNAWKKLKIVPDVIMVDGHGIAHPRRLGIAAHFGLMIGKPTLGCAKNMLYGAYDEPLPEAGSFSYIRDMKAEKRSGRQSEKFGEEPAGEVIGTALRTKRAVKPVFVSPGNLMSVDDALRIAVETTRLHRLPEPTRQAHLLVNEFRLGRID
ncbi:MAG: deoxyribonuclease [Candidatus Taylorbacteria bacterium]|nr:deoxyribonuclease [Candidatus Taylorbacteria bacterium]